MAEEKLTLTKIPKWLEGNSKREEFDEHFNSFSVSRKAGNIFIDIRSYIGPILVIENLYFNISGGEETLSEDGKIYTVVYNTEQQSGFHVEFNYLDDDSIGLEANAAGVWVKVAVYFDRVS